MGSMKASILALYLGMTPVRFHWSFVTFFSIRAAVDMMIRRIASRSMTLPLKVVFSPNLFIHNWPPGFTMMSVTRWVKKLFHDGLKVVIEVGKLALVEGSAAQPWLSLCSSMRSAASFERSPVPDFLVLLDEVLQEHLVLPFGRDCDGCHPFSVIQRKGRATHEEGEDELSEELDEGRKLVIKAMNVSCDLLEGHSPEAPSPGSPRRASRESPRRGTGNDPCIACPMRTTSSIRVRRPSSMRTPMTWSREAVFQRSPS